MLVKSNSVFLGLLVLCGTINASSVVTDLENKMPILFLVQKGSEWVVCQASDSAVGTSTIRELVKEHSPVGTATTQELAQMCPFTDSYQLHKHDNPELYDSSKKPSAQAAQD